MTTEAVQAYEELKALRCEDPLVTMLKEGRFNDFDRCSAYNARGKFYTSPHISGDVRDFQIRR